MTDGMRQVHGWQFHVKLGAGQEGGKRCPERSTTGRCHCAPGSSSVAILCGCVYMLFVCQGSDTVPGIYGLKGLSAKETEKVKAGHRLC